MNTATIIVTTDKLMFSNWVIVDSNEKKLEEAL